MDNLTDLEQTQYACLISAWGVVDCINDMNVLQSTWLFKLKCFPDGLIESSEPGFVPREISKFRALTFLKHMHLLFNGQQFI